MIFMMFFVMFFNAIESRPRSSMKSAAKTLGLGLEEESSFDWRIVLQFGELYFDFSGFIKIVHGIVLCCVLPSKHDFLLKWPQ